MVRVLQEDKLTIIYAKYFLYFEWKFEDRSKTALKSKEFDIGGEKCSFLEFVGDCIYLHNPKPVENGHYILSICDNKNSSIECIIASIGHYDTENEKITLLGHWGVTSTKGFPITIFCTIRSLSNNISLDYNNLNELSSDCMNILEQSYDTDITLKTNGDIIRAHKLILQARSPVFHKMFQHDSSESANNSVAISDIGQATMMRLVKFLYSGAIEKCNFEETMELYYAADKYEVLSLRDACKIELFNQLDVNNACSLFILANRHEDDDIKKEVAQFVSSNFTSVVNADSFLDIKKDDMALLMRLCSYATKIDLK